MCLKLELSQMGLFVPAANFEHKIIWEIEFFCNLRLMSQSDQVSQFGSELSTMNRILNKKKSNSIRPSLYIIDNWGQGTLIGKFLGTFSRINYPWFRGQANYTCINPDFSIKSYKYNNLHDNTWCVYDWLHSWESQQNKNGRELDQNLDHFKWRSNAIRSKTTSETKVQNVTIA